MFGTFEVVVDYHVLVRGMCLCPRVPHSSGSDREIEFLQKDMVGTRAADHWDNCHRDAINVFGCINHDLDKWVIGVGSARSLTTEILDLNIGKTLLIKVCP